MGAKNVKEKIKKVLAFLNKTMYNINCCGMIAVKREVAAYKLAAFHLLNNRSLHSHSIDLLTTYIISS